MSNPRSCRGESTVLGSRFAVLTPSASQISPSGTSACIADSATSDRCSARLSATMRRLGSCDRGCMATAHRFEELDCLQLAEQLKIGQFASRPQVRADRRFRDQICDAAASISRNMAEGFVRRSNAAFAFHLDIARGSIAECQDCLKDARLRAKVSRRRNVEPGGVRRNAADARSMNPRTENREP